MPTSMPTLLPTSMPSSLPTSVPTTPPPTPLPTSLPTPPPTSLPTPPPTPLPTPPPTSVSAPQCGSACPDGASGNFPTLNCLGYMQCAWGQLITTIACPGGTVFDGSLQVCNWEWAVASCSCTASPPEPDDTPSPTTSVPTSLAPSSMTPTSSPEGAGQTLRPSRDCEEPEEGCGWGIWNIWTCQCDCAVGFCLSANQVGARLHPVCQHSMLTALHLLRIFHSNATMDVRLTLTTILSEDVNRDMIARGTKTRAAKPTASPQLTWLVSITSFATRFNAVRGISATSMSKTVLRIAKTVSIMPGRGRWRLLSALLSTTRTYSERTIAFTGTFISR